ncbi:uncharacterized protein LOC134714727 [Mytilus trossulus]|uniref:uncharacterized protein LOC134714727 n=1 Tax=Mytilus trossulus TaxID=6551 RepID=UPI00300687AC
MSSLEHSNPATITHEEVHVNIDKSSNGPAVIKTQPTVGYSSSGVIISEQSGSNVVTQGKPDGKRKPKDYVVTSCCVIMLCNFIFGFLGYHYGVKANHAWQLGDEVASKHHAKKAMIFVIVGILAGLATYALAFSLYFTLKGDTHEVHNSGMAG